MKYLDKNLADNQHTYFPVHFGSRLGDCLRTNSLIEKTYNLLW